MQRHNLPEHKIACIPALVDISDVVKTAGRLIPVDCIQQVKDIVANGKDNKYSKKILGTNFSVAKVGSKYFAIYKGEKHSKLKGKGAFGSVKLVQDMDDGSWAVMKLMSKQADKSAESHNKSVTIEVDNLKRVGQFLGHFQRESQVKGLQDVIIMKLASGVTVKNIIKNRSMPSAKWLDLSLGIARSVLKIFESGMLHRDIKPDNMMYDPALGCVTLIDFGLARAISPDAKSYVGGYAGSARYMAPEISKHDKKKREFNESTEVYALGKTLLECFSLEYVYGHVDRTVQFVEKVRNPFVQEEIRKLVESMLQVKPARRPLLSSIVETLQNLREYELDIVSKINSLAYVSVDEFLLATSEQKTNVMNSLKQVDEVQLCCHADAYNAIQCMQLRHELEVGGVCVLADVRVHNENELDPMMKWLHECTQDRAREKNMIYSNYYVRVIHDLESGPVNCYSRSINRFVVTSLHREMVVENISAQIVRIRDKNPMDTRLQLLRNFRHELQYGEIKTYQHLFNGLNTLQAGLLEDEQRFMRRSILRKFGFCSTVFKKVNDTGKTVVDDLHGLNRRNTGTFLKKK